MTAPDPAHPPRPGEGTGPLPQVASPPPSPHSTGPLPPMPQADPESLFLKALRRMLPQINDGRRTLRQGLAEILTALMQDVEPDQRYEFEDGLLLLSEIPELVLNHWLLKVANEELSLESFFGALVAEGYVRSIKRTLDQMSQQRRADPTITEPSALEIFNTGAMFDDYTSDVRMVVAERFAEKITGLLKPGLDAHTGNELVALLRHARGEG